MNRFPIKQATVMSAVLCLFHCFQSQAAQYVEITAELEFDNWEYWFYADANHLTESGGSQSIYPKSRLVRCVVGTNTWLIEGEFSRNARDSYWFTGSNIVTQTVITKASDPEIPRLGPVMLAPSIGERFTRVYECADGNPGRPPRVTDPLGSQAKTVWLALCSGPFLKRDGRQIYPVSDLWKQNMASPSGYPDSTVTFQDGLGLPRSMTLYAQGDKVVFQYQVHQSTNALGWSFPLEFYLVFNGPSRVARTNGWQVQFTAKGRIISIGPGAEPWIPTTR